MALERGKLSNVVRVAAGTPVGIATCSSSKKVYVKSVIAHASGVGVATGRAAVYFVANGASVSADNRIFDADIENGETIMFEPSYPLVLSTSGDALHVGTIAVIGIAATHINFIVTGDKES